MIPVLTAKQMTDADRYTQEELGLSQPVLMERAALSAYSVINELADVKTLRTLIVCGPGYKTCGISCRWKKIRRRGFTA